jgi:hypothetical protein
MRRVIVIQPARCKAFGPVLNGESRRNPLRRAWPFEAGWGGGGFRAALFVCDYDRNHSARVASYPITDIDRVG